MGKIGEELALVDVYEREFAGLQEAVEGGGDMIARAREEYKAKLVKAKKRISDMNDFHSDITKRWTTPSNRVLGHILHAPPPFPSPPALSGSRRTGP